MKLKSSLALILGAAGISVAVALLGVFVQTAPSRCQERMFQKSSIYGILPRRFLEIQPLDDQASKIFEIQYQISFQKMPVVRTKVSSFTCSILKEEKIPPDEASEMREKYIQEQ